MNRPDADVLLGFHFETAAVRGHLVRLESSLAEILGQHFYPAPVAALLGETLAASVLLGATIKFAGSLGVQAKSAGPIALLFAECTHERCLRGYAQLADGALGEAFPDLLAAGTLVITITPDAGQRYQGIVPLDAPRLAGCLEHYFGQSEQLPTCIVLAADGERAAGLLLQVLPGRAEDESHALRWEHLCQLTRTLGQDELLAEPFTTVLYRLFHEERVRVHEPEVVRFGCRCSYERAANTLRALGATEVHAVFAEQGAVLIHCEFCQQEYRFDAAALEALFPRAHGEAICRDESRPTDGLFPRARGKPLH
ncbi:MAG: Hsp33 family molecular chaperone HslO [Pseudomonadales bacterium]|jgi:molecular chaperone Hsp33|nr:Hsp33 family molecular chaperone HslO [Pseudomonadales bacterium]MCP5321242.1 Hsp33 family molecular chaperone HslO [Pseudomonadales bacterium]MCP5336156.1 Hsp33 family molecular chaperone HslO [Pseudomonadales bacterium]